MTDKKPGTLLVLLAIVAALLAACSPVPKPPSSPTVVRPTATSAGPVTSLLIVTARPTWTRTPMPSATPTPGIQTRASTSGDLDKAREALIMFFDALYKGDYRAAASYYGGGYSNLRSNYRDVDSQEGAALFKKVCEGDPSNYCRFFCWKIKDVVEQQEGYPGYYRFTVRFEDEGGNPLTGGDNQTPVPCMSSVEECPRSKYVYTVVKKGDKFLVQEPPVFMGCWY